MAILLGFGNGQLGDAELRQTLAQGVLDFRRGDQIAGGNVQVAVVLQHARVTDLRMPDAVEHVKVCLLEGAGDLKGAVPAEIEQQHAVAVFDGTGRTAVPINDKRGEILVDDARMFFPENADGIRGGGERLAFAQHMGVPAALDHAPVGFVAVHGDLHAPAAARDRAVKGIVVEFFEPGFQQVDIFECGSLADVPSVQQDVDAGTRDSLGFDLSQQDQQVIDMGMDVAVGQQPEEMEGPIRGFHAVHEFVPGVALKDAAGRDRFVDQLGTLAIDLTGAQRVVSDFGVAHVFVGGEADRGAVGLEFLDGIRGQKAVERRFVGRRDRVSDCTFVQPDAVHNHQNHGTFVLD